MLILKLGIFLIQWTFYTSLKHERSHSSRGSLQIMLSLSSSVLNYVKLYSLIYKL